jgi:hypothetical protein
VSRKTERVVLVSIDGIRNQEGVRFQVAPGQPHPYIPRMWSELASRGAIYTDMMLLEKTSTTTGVATLYSGYWNTGPNRFSVICECDGGYRDNRSHAPLLSEHVARDLGLGTSAVGFYHNKRNTLICDYSFHPSYGAAYSPGHQIWVDSKSPDNPYREDGDGDGIFEFLDGVNADDVLMDRVEQDLAYQPGRTDYPMLVQIHIGVVDLAGHSGQFSLYADALRNADDRVASLWEMLQQHPFYAGKTTLIVSTDHGRHDDDHGGFSDHNGSCFGCRNIFFLAVGPDTPAGVRVTRPTYHIDVAPTIAALLGFSMPHAQGRPLPEMLRFPAVSLDRITDHASLAAGSEVLVAATRDSSALGSHVALWRGQPQGAALSFSVPQVISTPGAMVAQRPVLAASSTGSLLAVFRELRTQRGYWTIRAAESTDAGKSFLAPRSILQGRREVESPFGFRMVVHPALQPLAASDDVVVPVRAADGADHLARVRSSDGFRSLDGVDVIARPPAGQSFTSEFDMATTVGLPDGDYGIAWVQLDRPFDDDPYEVYSYEIFYRRSLAAGGFGPAVRITNDRDPSFHPRMAHDAARDILYLVYANRSNGLWEVFLVTSADRGATWSAPVPVSATTGGAWKPSILVDAGGDRLVVAYEDHSSGGASVLEVDTPLSTGSLSTPRQIGAGIGLALSPELVQLASGEVFVTWEHHVPGKDRFEVRGARID